MTYIDALVPNDDSMCRKCVNYYKNEQDGIMSPECQGSLDLKLERDCASIGLTGKEAKMYQTQLNPVRWAKDMFDWTARWYQEDMLLCTALRKAVRCGRRIGKTEALVVDALHKGYVFPEKKILLIAPFQDQVDLIYQVLRRFMDDCPTLRAGIKRDNRSPQRIEWHNGNYLHGITAGTSTGMKGDKARGQDATDMYWDEADYLDQATIDSLLGIIASRDDLFLWASSTPTGARQFFYDWCFPAGTPVFMADGSYRDIESLQVGDEVVAADGSTDTVAQAHSHVTNELIELKVAGINAPLLTTPEHPFMTVRGEVRADHLQTDDMIRMTCRKDSKHAIPYPDVTNIRDKTAVLITDFVDSINEDLELKKKFALLLGYYLAEGHVVNNKQDGHKYTLGFKLSFRHGEPAVAKAVRLCNELFGNDKVTVYDRLHIDNTEVVTMHHAYIGHLLRYLGGEYSDGKRIHYGFLGDKDVERNIADAYTEGGGYIDHGTPVIVTTSRTLALQIQQIQLRAGYMSTLYTKEVPNKKTIWSVRRLKSTTSLHNKGAVYVDGVPCVKVQSTRRIDKSMIVYNIGTTITNTFSVGHLAVHNCIDKKVQPFREFHFPSSVGPNWTMENEFSLRQTMPEASFAHEFLADFSDAETGVYMQKHIDASLRDYDPNMCKRNPDKKYIYSLGVDWNEAKNGVQLIGMEYNPENNDMKVCLVKDLHDVEFTQLKAVQMIIDLHEVWNFDIIYVDKGFGDTQIQLLHRYGKFHPETRLGRIVKGISMGGKTLMRDPMTQVMEKFSTKHLMIDITARRVEVRQCVLPRSEDLRNHLVWEMRNFKAEKVNKDGIPMYTNKDDHSLVAWQLSIFALVMEFSPINRIHHSNKVAFVDVFNRHKDDSVKTGKKNMSVDLPARVIERVGPSGLSFVQSGFRTKPVAGRGSSGLRRGPGRRATF